MVLHVSTKNQNRAVATPYSHSKSRNLNFRRIHNTILKPQANLLILIVIAFIPRLEVTQALNRSHVDPGKEVTLEGLGDSTQSKDLKFPNVNLRPTARSNTLLIARLFAKPSRSLSLRSRGAWLAMAANLCGYRRKISQFKHIGKSPWLEQYQAQLKEPGVDQIKGSSY